MLGYKGFDSQLCCNGYQYKIGEEHTHDGNAVLCQSGFHFCENPLDVLGYYEPAKSRYAEIEAEDVSGRTDCDSKRVCRRLKIRAEIGLQGLISAGVKFILEKVDFNNAKESNTGYRSAATNTGYQSAATNTGYQSAAMNTGNRSAATNTGYQSAATNTGDRSAATNTGYRSAATNTGDRSAAMNTGNWSAATNTGNEGCAISLGIEGRASGGLGCWLTLAEWKQNSDDEWHRIKVKTVRVDGKKIKADIFYMLQNGKFVEAEGKE